MPDSSLARDEVIARRAWRIVAVLSLVVFLVGTHWPSLRLPEVEGGGPAADKFLHVIAFALMTVPWWWTGWFPRLWMLAVLGVVVAVLDEVTQELLPISRFFNVQDLTADVCGLAVAIPILWSLGPMGGEAARDEQARREASRLGAAAVPTNWLHFACAAALGAIVTVPLGVMLGPVIRIDEGVVAMGGAGLGAGAGGLIALSRAARHRRRRWTEPTFADDSIPPRWRIVRAAIPLRRIASLAWRPVLRSLVVVVPTLLLLRAAEQALFAGVTPPKDREEGLLDGLDPMTRAAIAIVVIALGAAWAIRATRFRLASILDAGDRWCVACGADLRAVEPGVEAGLALGRCPGCGGAFVARSPRLPSAASPATMPG